MERAEIRCKCCNEILPDMISATRHICLKEKATWVTGSRNKLKKRHGKKEQNKK